jgi:hypothetical protein
MLKIKVAQNTHQFADFAQYIKDLNQEYFVMIWEKDGT